MPVFGLVAKSSKTYETSQLVGRRATSAEDWKPLSRYLSAYGFGAFDSRHLSLTSFSIKERPLPISPPGFRLHLRFTARQLTGSYFSPRDSYPIPTRPRPSMPAPVTASIARPKRPPPMRPGSAPPPPTEAYPLPPI